MEEKLELLYKVKKQIMNKEKLIYNPIFMTEASKEKRENLLFRVFNKDFNQKCKAQRIDCDKDDINDISIKTDCLLIIDNIDALASRKKIDEITKECVNKNIQVIIFANDFEKPEKYDFSDESANETYKNTKGIEKFFAYMMAAKNNKGEFEIKKRTNDYFKESFKYLKKEATKYSKVIDPDSESKRLQDIYKKLWNIEEYEIIKNKIQGDTLNSTNTTLNEFYKYIEEKLDKNKIEEEKEINKRGRKMHIHNIYLI